MLIGQHFISLRVLSYFYIYGLIKSKNINKKLLCYCVFTLDWICFLVWGGIKFNWQHQWDTLENQPLETFFKAIICSETRSFLKRYFKEKKFLSKLYHFILHFQNCNKLKLKKRYGTKNISWVNVIDLEWVRSKLFAKDYFNRPPKQQQQFSNLSLISGWKKRLFDGKCRRWCFWGLFYHWIAKNGDKCHKRWIKSFARKCQLKKFPFQIVFFPLLSKSIFQWKVEKNV